MKQKSHMLQNNYTKLTLYALAHIQIQVFDFIGFSLEHESNWLKSNCTDGITIITAHFSQWDTSLDY